MPRPFVHLHLHTQYSLLDGAIKHDPLFQRANALNMPAVAMTDHGNLFGAVEFYERGRDAGIKPIIGCEVYIAAGSRFDKEKRERDASGFDAISHLLLLAMNETGYKNLIYLVSKAYLDGFYYRPRIDMDLLRSRSEGLIATSGCLSSMVCRAITGGQLERAWSLTEEFSRIFPDRFYLEMQRHGIPDQDTVNAELAKMAVDMRLPLLATNDAHYLEHEDHECHDALLCIGTASNLDTPNRFKFDGEGFYVRDGDEMAEIFHDHPSAVTNTLEIAERCDVEIPMGEFHMPEFQVPRGMSREDVMEQNAWAGLKTRLGLAPDEPLPKRLAEYGPRMEHELGVIRSMGFAGYFLIVADFIDYARRQKIPVGPGRGSSAGSLVAFGLGITGIDPIEYDIIFERFLNPERISMPDIDVDFCMRGRDEVIKYVADKYDEEGEDNQRVSQIVTFGTLQARAAIRDVGRVLGMPYGDVDRVAKSGAVMTQWDMRCVEKTGLIKFDFLGLKTLTLVHDAEERIQKRLPEFSIDAAPLDDEAAFDLICRGDNEGVFQLESSGITELGMKLKPRTFKEIIPLVGLYRPGPLGSGMVDDYVSRKHGLTKVEYLVPELEELTAETLGVIVYQDQVLQIANRLAGYSLGEADLLRRAMGKKKKEEMAKHEKKFIDGATERGVPKGAAAEIFRLMAEFAGYGFPKAHSTAYALITYQTAYLKANHPREFMAALLSIEAGNNDKLARYMAHARERKIEVLPPDVNESERDFTVVAEGIRFGMAGVKNVGEGAIEAIVEERERSGHFESLYDFCERVDTKRANRRVAESLVRCGAFDSLHSNRAAVWTTLDAALEGGAAAQRDREIGQESLFGNMTDGPAAAPELPDAPAWTDQERLSHEKEVLGFYVTGHPLESVASDLARYADVTATTAHERFGREVRVGGLLTGLRETRTRRGDTMAFGTLEDLEGAFDLVIFAEPYSRLRTMLKEAKDGEAPLPLLVSGKLEEGDPPKVLLREVFPLSEAQERLAARLHVRVLEGDMSRDRMLALRQVMASHRGDCGVVVHLVIPGESETLVALPDSQGVDATEALVRDIDGLFGRPVSDLEH